MGDIGASLGAGRQPPLRARELTSRSAAVTAARGGARPHVPITLASGLWARTACARHTHRNPRSCRRDEPAPVPKAH